MAALPPDEVQIEIENYNALVREGGRPSHPIELLENVVRNPGKYREILTCWQEHPDDCNVFEKQLIRWRKFRDRQRCMRKPGRFAEYVADSKERLATQNLVRHFQFHEDASQQDKLMTWIEYLTYEYWKCQGYVYATERDRPQYDRAWKTLVDSNVLYPSDTEDSICMGQSITELNQQHERLLAGGTDVIAKEDRVRMATNTLGSSEQPGRDIRLQRLAAAKAELEKAQSWLSAYEKRTICIAEFMGATVRYRGIKCELERSTVLVRWILKQIPLIKLELNPPKTRMRDRDRDPAGILRRNHLESSSQADRVHPASVLPSSRPLRVDGASRDAYTHLPRVKKPAASLNSDSDSNAPTFHHFQQLPTEIRLKIWEYLVLARPTVHFFDVVNHRLARHHQHLWSNKEFRLRASPHHGSGYHHLLPLMGTCREARVITTSYYRKQTPRRLTRAGATSTSRTEGSHTRTGSQRYLAPFDWIPLDDLIVLCLPPRQVSRFPATHDITLAGRPHIGFAVPFERLEDADTAAAAPLLLRELIRTKPPRVYLLSRLRAFAHSRPNGDISWIERWAQWSGSQQESQSHSMAWEDFQYEHEAGPGRRPKRRDEGRWFFWVGTESRAALVKPQMGDLLSGTTFLKMQVFQRNVEDEGKKYWGQQSLKLEMLGWLVQGQPAAGSDLQTDDGDSGDTPYRPVIPSSIMTTTTTMETFLENETIQWWRPSSVS